MVFVARMMPMRESLGDLANYAFRAVPSYSLGSSVYFESEGELLKEIRMAESVVPFNDEVWALENNLLDVVTLGAHFLLWSCVLAMAECGAFKKCASCCSRRKKQLPAKKPKKEVIMDNDVAAERARVAKTLPGELAVRVHNFKKIYPVHGEGCEEGGHLAVESVSFGLDGGDCFALLGANGAGKTTTFNSLTGEISLTGGSIHIGGHEISSRFSAVKKLLGYCPQQNLVFDDLSVEENIDYFAALKGIPTFLRTNEVNRVIKALEF